MKKIFLYESNRSLLLFLLINNFLEDDIIYLFLKKDYDLDLLPGEKIKYNPIKNLKRKSIIYRTFGIKKFRNDNKKLFLDILKNKCFLYGMDHTFLGREVFFKEKMILLEDGLINYTFQNFISRKRLKREIRISILKIAKLIFGISMREEVYGLSDKIFKIYYTKNLYKKINDTLSEKSEIIDLKKLWQEKSEREKEIILKIFKVDTLFIRNLSSNTILLLTQPLSEQNIITEKEKIKIYSKVLENYNLEDVLIKTHPNETTDYSKYFKKCKIMKEKYPIEILGLLGVNIRKIATLFSSAAFGIGRNIPIDFYGTEVSPKLFNIFGTQDNIMKRNAFIEEEKK